MADSTLKPNIPSLGGIKSQAGGLPKLPQIHAPNSMGLKSLSVPGASKPAPMPKLATKPPLPSLGGLSKPSLPTPASPSGHAPAAPIATVPPAPDLPAPPDAMPEPDFSGLEPDPDLGATMALDPDQIPSSLPEAPFISPDAEIPDASSAEDQDVPQEPSLMSDADIASAFDTSTESAQEEPAPEPALSEPAQPEPALSESISSEPMPQFADSSIDPNVNDDELLWEDEESGDGEKTQMLEMPDFDEDEADGEKTQIQMEAFSFEPLSGTLFVEAGQAEHSQYHLSREHIKIGRSQKNEIVIQDSSFSRHHLTITKEPGGFRIMDPGSSNGVFLNGSRIISAQLRPGDIIEAGNLRFRFEQSGGDPSELWQGPPAIEYHPNQAKPKTGAAAHPINYPNKNPGTSPSPSPAAAPFHAPSAPVAPAPAPAHVPSETMLERAGGGLAAPQWGPPVSSMTSPYMMSYAGNMQPNRETPTWAYILISAASAFCLIAIIALCISWLGYKSRIDEQAQLNAEIKHLSQSIENGVSFYGEKLLEDARTSFREAEKINIPDKGDIIEKYMLLLDEESELNTRIMAANRDFRQKQPDELEQDIKSFSTVSPDSVFYSDIFTKLLPKLKKELLDHLSNDARNLAKDGNIDEARKIVARISKLENSAHPVKDLNNYIDAQIRRRAN